MRLIYIDSTTKLPISLTLYQPMTPYGVVRFWPEGLITRKIVYEISKSWDFAEDFRISGKISRFQDFMQDFRQDFKISCKISRFHDFNARFQDFMQDFRISMQDFQISTKISARFPDSSADFDIRILNFRMM